MEQGDNSASLSTPGSTPTGVKRKREGEDDDDSVSEPEPEDDVKLWDEGWKDRYYEVKFRVDNDDIIFRHKVVAAYVEGLCWTLQYYFQGCASWNWFFPYHYPPFASDFINIGDIKIDFAKGKPFKPLEQLMAVLPPSSKQHVPEPWGKLMYDPESKIKKFYPDDFKIDLNGKRFAWQGVPLLPFVDKETILEALESVYPKLTNEEIKRNEIGNDRLYVRQGHEGYDFFVTLYEKGSNRKTEMNMNPKLFSGISGTVILSEDVIHPKGIVHSPLNALPDLPGNLVICVNFMAPQYPDNFIFPAARLESATDPPKVLKPDEMPVPDYRSNSFRRQNFRRPQVGMAPWDKNVALTRGGHRMLNYHLPGSSQHGQGPNEPLCGTYPPGQHTLLHHPVNFGHGSTQVSQDFSRNPERKGESLSDAIRACDEENLSLIPAMKSGRQYDPSVLCTMTSDDEGQWGPILPSKKDSKSNLPPSPSGKSDSSSSTDSSSN